MYIYTYIYMCVYVYVHTYARCDVVTATRIYDAAIKINVISPNSVLEALVFARDLFATLKTRKSA